MGFAEKALVEGEATRCEGHEFGALRVAVVLPCHNEAAAITRVVAGFRKALPGAEICVFDNASTDDTARLAAKAGAKVYREPRKGKGNVVRRMFADVEADIYVMADGDGTYDPADAPLLVTTLLAEKVDMVVGTRRGVTEDAGRAGHAVGNMMFNRLYGRLFGKGFTDIFSGYRVFSRRFVKSFPAISTGFEIETEMSVHASQLKIPVTEIALDYGRREEGSSSKLHTWKDGSRILFTFAMLLKEVRPTAFFGLIAAGLALLSVVLSVPLFIEFAQTGLVPRIPTAILVTGMMVMAALLAIAGVILDSLSRARVEQKRILYLMQPRLGEN
ncbi:MAG: glycosyltransferase [Hyphomicrobiaceae bacterium]|nr:glycosyltransferase [Hyphomicrobiaceae bacterium]